MRNPLSSFIKAQFIAGGFFLTLILAAWLFGRRFGMSGTAVLVTIGVILAIWLLVTAVLLIRRRVRKSKSKELARAAESETPQGLSPLLSERLDRTIQWLKKSKLAKAGRDPMYDLPWYIFVGMPGSGKSTIIAQSGFSYSYTEPRRALGKANVAPTDACDIWVANEAVFIDPSGKYFSQDSLGGDWRAALAQVRGRRKAKPVDGIVLVADVDSLLTLGLEGLREQAARMRACLDMTAHEFGMVLPIYLLFNKSDRIEGFEEFCSDRGNEEPLGAMFRREQYRNPHPEREFQLEFDAIYRRLLSRRTALLAEKTEQLQEKAFAFPEQLSLIRDQLSSFVELLFQLDQFRERPLLRGFYFISSLQAGSRRDLVSELLNAKAGLPKPDKEHGPEGARSFFINSLFNKVIVPDRSLAGISPQLRRRRRLVRMMLAGLAAIILPIVLMLFVWGAYQDNSSLVHSVEVSRGIAVGDGKTAQNLTDLIDLKNRLENLECRGQTNECRLKGRAFHWGMSAGDTLLGQARGVFLDKTRQLFMDQLFYGDISLGHKYNGLRTQLALVAAPPPADPAQPDDNSFDPVQAYTLLKTFLMFSAETKADASFLEQQCRDYWIHGVQEKDQPMAMELLRFYLHQLGDHRNPAYRSERSLADEEAIDKVRKLLLVVEPERYYFGIIQEEGGRKVNSVTLAGVLEGVGVEIFNAGSTVDGTFTKVGWDTYARDKILEMKRDYEEERSWVLGTTAAGPGQSRIDEKLRAEYFRRYEESWWNFLSGVSSGPFISFQDASQKLAILADSQQSPVLRLFRVVSANSWKEITEQNAQGGGVLKDASGAAAGEPDAVAQHFQSVHTFVATSENKESPLVQYLKSLSRLQVVIRSFLDANQPAAQIGEIGKEADAALQVTNGLLVNFDANARQAAELLLKQPIQNVLAIIDRAMPVGSGQDGRRKSLLVAGAVKENGKNLEGATVALLEAYPDNRFQSDKEIMRTQTRNGAFQLPKPINPGSFKICASKKDSKDFYCGDVRLGQDANAKTFELRRPRSLVVFGGGKLDLTVLIK